MPKYIPHLWVGYRRPHQMTVDVEAVDDAAKYPLGMEVTDRDGCVYRYGKAQAEVTQNNFVKEHTTAHEYNHTGAALQLPAGVAHVTIAANKFGWIKVKGVHAGANVATGSTAGKPLATSSTAGRMALQDAGASYVQAEARAALHIAAGLTVTAITDATSNAATVRLS